MDRVLASCHLILEEDSLPNMAIVLFRFIFPFKILGCFNGYDKGESWHHKLSGL